MMHTHQQSHEVVSLSQRQVVASTGPADFAGGPATSLELVLAIGSRGPDVAEVKQVHEEVVDTTPTRSVRTPCCEPPAFAPSTRRPATSTDISGALSVRS